MAIQIGSKPDSGFDDPIGMLTDCHRRIEHFLDILCVVINRAQARSMTEEETAAVLAALQYFRLGGQRHNADEEESLFPRLRKADGGEELNDIHGLESDHQDANRMHAKVEDLYEKWIRSGALAPHDREELLSATQHLNHLYTEHIRLEEQVVFPRAAKLLSPAAIRAMGQEFQARRK